MASDDISNSESLKLALRIDQDLRRTICVLTKLDQFEGSSQYLARVLSGEIISIKMGVICVSTKNSSQNDKLKNTIDSCKELKEGLNFGFEILLSKI